MLPVKTRLKHTIGHLNITPSVLQEAGILLRQGRKGDRFVCVRDDKALPTSIKYVAKIAPGADAILQPGHYPKLVAQIGKANFMRAAGKIPTAAQYAARNASCDQVDIVSISSASNAQMISFYANCANVFQSKFSEADLNAYTMDPSHCGRTGV